MKTAINRTGAAIAGALCLRVWLVLAFVAEQGGCVSTTGPKNGRVVDSVVVVGNRAVSDKELVQGLETRPPRGLIRRRRVRLDEHALEADRARIETYYRRKGFYSAEVSTPDVQSSGSDRASVRFVVDEGLPSLVSSIDVSGAPRTPDITEEALRRRMSLRPDERFDHDRYLRTKDALLRFLVDHGYAYASVSGTAEVHPATRKVDVRFEIVPGPMARFGDTTVTGLERIPLSAIENRLAWDEGDVFDPSKLRETRQQIHELQMFSSVRVDFDPNARAPKVPMRITVIEAPRHTLRLGGGIGIDRVRREIRGRAGYDVAQVFGMPLTTLSLEARPAYASIRGVGGQQGLVAEASAALHREDLFWPLLRGSVMLSYAIEELEAHTSQGTGLRLALRRMFLARRLHVAAGYELGLLQFLRVSDAIDDALARELGLESPYRIATLEQHVAYDRRDDPVVPRLGFYAELLLEEGNSLWGSEFSFVKATPELRGFVPLGGRVTLAARARMGLLLSGDTLPITERYFAGGATSHRGFGLRRLSPVASSAEETVGIGGNALWESSLETRVDVLRVYEQWLSFAAFVDGGDTRLEVKDLELSNPHVAVGGGLRYRTLLGPVRFDLGYRINRTGPGEPEPGGRWAFHFTLGEAF